jgi:hypothetical protein
MGFRRLLVLAMLVGWVLFSPVAIAFGGCSGMESSCEGPCILLPSYALHTATPPAVLLAVTYIQPERSVYLPAPVLKRLKPPPKSICF